MIVHILGAALKRERIRTQSSVKTSANALGLVLKMHSEVFMR